MTGEVGVGVELTPEIELDRLSELATVAESVGFDTVFVSHHYNNRDEFVALADIASATVDVALGPGVTNPYEAHPVALASRMASLDELADGRGIFGIGAGDRSTLQNLGIERESPLGRVLETMQVARKLWAGERVEHQGTFTASDAALNYEAGSIPVYVGAQGPHMTRMAAKYADGVLYNGSHIRDVRWASERVEEGLGERSDGADAWSDGTAFDFGVYASVSVAEDRTAAREAARPPVAFIAGGSPVPVLERHGIDPERATAISDAIAAGKFHEAFETVTADMVDSFCIAGTPETVFERLEEILAIADSVVMGSPLGPNLEQSLRLMDAAPGLNRG